MITNNSFLDGITHRQMRKHLLESFDDIYILDLHGNSKKKEKALDGGKDENVFDIQQGVAISIFVRREGEKKGFGIVHHTESYGKRENKFHALNESDMYSVKWKALDYSEPYYFFVPKDFGAGEEYDKGFKVDDLFPVHSSGIETQKDSLVIQFTEQELEKVRNNIEFTDETVVRSKYGIKDSRDWNLDNAQQDLQQAKDVQILSLLSG